MGFITAINPPLNKYPKEQRKTGLQREETFISRWKWRDQYITIHGERQRIR